VILPPLLLPGLTTKCQKPTNHINTLIKSSTLPAVDEATVDPGNTKGGSITVPLTSCLTGFESSV